MAENTPKSGDVVPSADQSVAKPQMADRVGDLLRKERVTKRIAIETIARDLKLNVKYMKSLEASDYDNLPADPYIRVYVRSISKYLMLDSEEILKKFYKERGLLPEEDQSNRATTKLDVAMNVHQKKTKIPWPVVIGLIGILIVVGYIASKMHLGTQSAPALAVSDSSAIKQAAIAPDTVADSIPEKRPDSLDTVVATPASSTQAKAQTPGPAQTQPQSPVEKPVPVPVVEKKDSLIFTIHATIDSVWVQVFYDGKPWKNVLRAGETRIFKAADSLNVHVGRNAGMTYTFRGKPVNNILGTSVTTFKLSRAGVEQWPLTKWMSVFKNRQ